LMQWFHNFHRSLLRRWPRPRSRTRPWCWICADYFELSHHSVVLMLKHVTMEHVDPCMIGEL
jgi:hypothetical protein